MVTFTKGLVKAIALISLTAISIAGMVTGNILVTGVAVGALAGWLTNEKNNSREE